MSLLTFTILDNILTHLDVLAQLAHFHRMVQKVNNQRL